MENWHGNDIIFRTYFPGDPEGDGKKPKGRVKRAAGHSFDEVSLNECFGAVMKEGFIDISFDDKEMSEAFIEMAKANCWDCLILENQLNGHVHSYWKNIANRIKTKSAKDKKLSVGLIADIHGGSTYIPLKVHGYDRLPVYDIAPGAEYQEVPDELLPVGAKANLWDLSEGEGRNDALSSMAKYLSHNTRFDREQIRRILGNANRFVLKDPVDQNELDTILRDDTFNDMPEKQSLNIVNAAELSSMDLKPVEFIIDGLVPVGLTLLASPPKYGKSWFCLNMALAVATGSDFLGFSTHRSRVLYMALEDRLNRPKQRIKQILGSEPAPTELLITTESCMLDNGFLDQLKESLISYTGIRLVIIDTFAKVRGAAKKTESAYSYDYREAGDIKKFADENNIAIVLVTHTRKSIDPDDPFINITGTHGVNGAADDMIVLTKKKRDDEITKMSITGRDVSFDEIVLTFDTEHGRWIRQEESYELFTAKMEVMKQNAEYMVSPIRKTIIRLLDENNGCWSGFYKEILNKSREYRTPIPLTSQQLGKKLDEYCIHLNEDNIIHTLIDRGEGQTKIHKFERACNV